MLGNDLLRGELVRLDALDRADVDTFGPWWRDLELIGNLSQTAAFPFTVEDELEWFESMRKNKDVSMFAIRRIDTGALIGTTSLFDVNWRIRKCLFGIAIGDKSAWGQGYGTDATRLALRYAFMELNLNRVQLHVYSFNDRARRAYEKAGFILEGTLRDAVYRDGRHHDEHVMAVLRRDWEADRPPTGPCRS